MNLTEDRLRAALLETAEQIPPGAVPPLELPAGVQSRIRSRQRPAGRPRRWLAALSAAAAVCVIISLSFTLAGRPSRVPPTGQLAEFPPYYVALQQAPGCGTCGHGSGSYYTNPDRAVVRSTVTGRTLTTIAAPRPYGTFAFVQGTADAREFILGAQRLANWNPGFYPATKLYLMRLNPSARPGHQAQLTALPVPLLPDESGYQLDWLALSPNGQLLAAISSTTSTNNPMRLRVYDLVTGGSRTWVLPKWAERDDLDSDVAGPPSWSPNSQTLAFFDRASTGSAEVVLLDTSAPSASFSADSRPVPLPRPPGTDEVIFGPDFPLLTPDGRHVLEEVISQRELELTPRGSPLDAFALEVVNVRTGAARQLRQRSRMFFALASDPSGSAVIVAVGNMTPYAEAFVAWTARGTTAIQMPPDTIAVAW